MASFWSKANGAKRGLIRRGAVALVVYEAAFMGTFYWVYRTKAEGSLIWWLALLPTLTVVGFVLVLARYLKEEVDEFHRELVVRCLLWGLAALMVVLAYQGLLQLLGWKGGWPVWVDMAVFLLAMGAAKLTYKVANRPPAEDAITEGRV